jgi:hypothetical protein
MTFSRHLPALLSIFREPRQPGNSQLANGLVFWVLGHFVR